MRIFGIDPGTANLGWGVVDFEIEKAKAKSNGVSLVAYGLIKTKPTEGVGRRLFILRKELTSKIQIHKPDHIVVEQLFFGANSQTAMLVGQARGVILLTAEEFSLPVFECQGLSVKKILTGFGRTDKRAMQEAVTRFLNLSDIPKPNDAADALAIAIFHTLRLRGVCGKKKK